MTPDRRLIGIIFADLARLGSYSIDKYQCRKQIEAYATSYGYEVVSDKGSVNYGIFLTDNFAVKVVDVGDSAYLFLRAVFTKTIRSRHYPKVYAMKQLGRYIFVFVMERLENLPNAGSVVRAIYNEERDPDITRCKKAYDALHYHGIYGRDLHAGNIMARGSTLVMMDPVS